MAFLLLNVSIPDETSIHVLYKNLAVVILCILTGPFAGFLYISNRRRRRDFVRQVGRS